MTATADAHQTTPMKERADALFRRKRLWAFGIPLLILAYLVYAAVAFDIVGVLKGASGDNARTLIRDAYSYKTYVTRQNRTGDVQVSIENERHGIYDRDNLPSFVTEQGDTTTTDLGHGYVVHFHADGVDFNVPGYGLITAQPGTHGVQATLPDGQVPDWINASHTRVAITTPAGRVTITRAKTEVFKYHFGWEMFFFTMESPYFGMGPGQVFSHAIHGEAPQIWHDFWQNPMWHHKQVAWALFETILMAFLGTFGAAIVALPLAFLAARNFTPFMLVRQVFRRIFDLCRGIDALIWTIILARAFGPGPMTGALSILLTDTGSFGKMFSEVLENIDEKQAEGIRSTGANPVQRYRFGVIPQVMPVLLSLVLYFFESNTRSATIIGAITGGGIGLLLTQAMYTQKDWEEVSYYIILIVIMVFVLDWISGKVRDRLIRGGDTAE